MDLLSSTLLIFLSFYGAKSTFSPSGSVSIDCGGQQTFTCTVAANGPATWTITGLQGITAGASNGIATGTNNARITSAEIVAGVTSTITITGFTTADNGGTIRCDDQALAVEGSAAVVVGPPQCGRVGMNVTGNDSCPCFTFTPLGNILPSTVVISYHLVQADPSSAGSLNCDYPIDPRMCKLNVSGGTYTVRATPQNNCDPPSSSCTATITVNVPANCTIPEELTSAAPGCPQCWLLLLLLLLLIPVVYSICVALVWHLYYKDYNYCQVYWCCCFCKPREGDGKIRTSSTEPMKASPPPPRPPAPVAAAAPLGEYADPKDVRKRKEENKIQYADLEFTKQSGGGQGTIHQKEEPVTYTAIQHV